MVYTWYTTLYTRSIRHNSWYTKMGICITYPICIPRMLWANFEVIVKNGWYTKHGGIDYEKMDVPLTC